MYSYEDRIRAVKLYIKLGKRLGATIRQLGYPTKNSLIGWYRDYEQGHDLQVGYARTMQKYSAQQKQAAVQHYLDHDRCIAFTLKAMGYPCREKLTAWIDELHPDVRKRVVGRAPNVQHHPQLKNAAVIELCTRKTSAQEIAQKLAVCRPTLYNWKNQLLGREAPASMKCQND
jgi:putative transposase